jgi:hypothetical protein
LLASVLAGVGTVGARAVAPTLSPRLDALVLLAVFGVLFVFSAERLGLDEARRLRQRVWRR